MLFASRRSWTFILVGFVILACAFKCCCGDGGALVNVGTRYRGLPGAGLDMMMEDLDQRKGRCPPGEIPCGNISWTCLPRELHCDGRQDCDGGEDERDCADVYGGLHTLMGVFSKSTIQNITEAEDVSHRRPCNNTNVPEACYCDHYSKKKRVFCENANLTKVPKAIADATRLVFTNNSLGIIPADAFYGYTNLTSLMIINSISGISPEAFRSLGNLGIMTIENNHISKIHLHTFSGLSNLGWLTFKYNHLKEFNFDAIEDMPKLELLNLEGNGFTRIPKPLPEHTFLTWLDLKKNLLAALPKDTFLGLKNLQVLILRDNSLLHIHQEAFQGNTKLQELDLSGNSLSSLPPGLFKGLRDIKKIDLSLNPLKNLPVTLFHDLRSLNSLNLSGVEVSNIDIRHFRHLPKLEFIYFKKFHYCSYAPYVRICVPKTDGLSSTEHLLVWPVLRLSVWVVALTTCAGNSVVLTWRVLSKKEDRVLSLFIKNLSSVCCSLFTHG